MIFLMFFIWCGFMGYFCFIKLTVDGGQLTMQVLRTAENRGLKKSLTVNRQLSTRSGVPVN